MPAAFEDLAVIATVLIAVPAGAQDAGQRGTPPTAKAAASTPKPNKPATAKTVTQDPPTPVIDKPGGMSNRDWWPTRLDLTPLRQHEDRRILRIFPRD